jgi:O-methyltransferase involved in polyketide biosynthesis
MRNSTPTADYNRISPTAKIPAYWRALSDIPYSKEIAQAVNAEETVKEFLGESIIFLARFSPILFEARYKSIDRGIEKSGLHNVLELACGLSPRGLELVTHGKKYVGTDLPDILAETAPIMTRIAERQQINSENLHYQPVNVFNKEELEAAIAHFNGEPFVVCNEGLLPYFSKEEKATMAIILHELLTRFNSCWITTDVSFNSIRQKFVQNLSTEAKQTFLSNFNNLTNRVGRDIIQNDFINEQEALEFYQQLGFEIEAFPLYDGSYQPSIPMDHIPEQVKTQMLQVLSTANAWVLRPAR